jgi:hypothetical protein
VTKTLIRTLKAAKNIPSSNLRLEEKNRNNWTIKPLFETE